MQPGQGAFDDPARATEATAVWRSAFRELRLDPAPVKHLAVRLGIVPAVALDQRGFAPGTAGPAAQRGDAVHQRQQLGDVIPVGAGQHGGQGNPARFSQKVMLRPRLTAIGRVRSSFFPPRSARTEPPSTRARAKSSWPRCRNSASSAAWSRRQTPARCQPTRRRQHVLPDPQPISFGSICHGSPLRRTNKSRSMRRGPAPGVAPSCSIVVAAASVTAARSGPIRHRRSNAGTCVTASLSVTRPYQFSPKSTRGTLATFETHSKQSRPARA
jgi:hypothetical protein